MASPKWLMLLKILTGVDYQKCGTLSATYPLLLTPSCTL
ncbi:hypothetical protein SLEP1_g44827 [Rubroshorea leprosula]|uniref:Uncharacterized protein n=1 Tax=Rubroshorea leprosula TaxID=152421 RepID=A0AAV5LHB4_9ROSI|nr:hypothetical protein SLEP1_g44827 [Rubroshorea leprosula]